jgi:TfoX/Sxy family transcriptional regulator of competence genes
MQWRKPPEELVELFHTLIPDDPAIDFKPMFGTPAYFTGGNMFACVHQESVIVRLGDDQRRELLALPGAAQFEPMEGRPMREYVALPPDMDHAAIGAWIAQAFGYAASLPQKVKKPRKTGTTRRG